MQAVSDIPTVVNWTLSNGTTHMNGRICASLFTHSAVYTANKLQQDTKRQSQNNSAGHGQHKHTQSDAMNKASMLAGCDLRCKHARDSDVTCRAHRGSLQSGQSRWCDKYNAENTSLFLYLNGFICTQLNENSDGRVVV